MTCTSEPPFDRRDALRRHYRDILSQSKRANEALHDLSWKLDELEQEIAALADDPAPALPEVRRLRDLRFWKSTLEDRIVHALYEVDELTAQADDARRALEQSAD